MQWPRSKVTTFIWLHSELGDVKECVCLLFRGLGLVSSNKTHVAYLAVFCLLLKSIWKDGDFIVYVQYFCCSENQKSFPCPTISPTQWIDLPPTPTQPYTHACPTATGLLCAYMYTWNLGIQGKQMKAEMLSADMCYNNRVQYRSCFYMKLDNDRILQSYTINQGCRIWDGTMEEGKI